jgi:MinD superfamily P-loop ATPase
MTMVAGEVVTHVLSGLGGVGKTQLAADLARRLIVGREVDLVVWVDAADRSTILARYAQAATNLALASRDEGPQAAERSCPGWRRPTNGG